MPIAAVRGHVVSAPGYGVTRVWHSTAVSADELERLSTETDRAGII
jgi:hypothetical protein